MNHCPLCNQANHCSNPTNTNKPCWCMNKDLSFPAGLFNQLDSTTKNKVCICQACVLKHTNSSVKEVT